MTMPYFLANDVVQHMLPQPLPQYLASGFTSYTLELTAQKL